VEERRGWGGYLRRTEMEYHAPHSEVRVGSAMGGGKEACCDTGLASAELGYPWDDLNWRLEV
jgi:hypothetical protein